MNSDPDSDGEDDYAFDPDKVAEYRKKILSAPVENSKAVLEEMIGQRKEEAEDDDMDWDEEILGEMEGGYDNCRFSSYWDSDSGMTYPLILAKIPVKNPWEVFAYLPFGRESIVESQRPAGKGQSGEHVKKQPLYRADMRSVLDSCFDIDPVEKRFDRLAYGTHIRRKGIVRGNLFVEQFLAGRY